MHKYEAKTGEERKSKNVGAKDYVLNLVDALKYSAVGGGGGFLLGKVFKDSKGNSRSFMLSQIGGVGGFLIHGFKDWRTGEAHGKAIEDSYDDIQKALDASVSDESLTKDNALVRKMIAHEDERYDALTGNAAKRPSGKVNSAHHDGVAANIENEKERS